MSDDEKKVDEYPCLPCIKCGKSFYFYTERTEPYVCYSCRRRDEKRKRKVNRGKASVPHHAKPLAPKGAGYSFVPDKMVSPSCTKIIFSDGSRISNKDATIRRAHRKRQRRVNSYFVKLALDSIED